MNTVLMHKLELVNQDLTQEQEFN